MAQQEINYPMIDTFMGIFGFKRVKPTNKEIKKREKQVQKAKEFLKSL